MNISIEWTIFSSASVCATTIVLAGGGDISRRRGQSEVSLDCDTKPARGPTLLFLNGPWELTQAQFTTQRSLYKEVYYY